MPDDKKETFRPELRQEAEARLRQQGLDRLPADLRDAESLLEELRVHHIELEIQNEELRRAEQALEQARHYYQQLYHQAPIGYFEMDLTGLILSVNRAGSELLGYPAEKLVGTRFERFVAHSRRDDFYLHRRQVIDTGSEQQIELSLLAADRPPRYALLISALRHLLETEEPPRLLVAALDRTEHHRLEEAYRQLVEQSLQGLAIVQDGRLVFANPALAAITGYSTAELLAMDWTEFKQIIHPEEREQAWIRSQARLAGQAVSPEYELRFSHRSGQEHWLEVHAVQIEYQGRPAVQASLLDITARKRAEQALEQSQKFIERVSNAAPMVIYIYDLVEDRTVYVNEQIESILGYTVEAFAEFQADVVNTLVHPDDQAQSLAHMRQVAAGEPDGQVYENEYRMRHANGTWRWVLSRDVVFTRTAEGTTRQVLGAMEDITRRKENEVERERLLAEVRQQREALRALSARLAELQETERQTLSRELHDQIGQNLTALGFNLQFVRSQLAEASTQVLDERLADSLALVEETTDRVRDLLAELRPPMLEADGLADSLAWYGRQFAARTGLEIQVADKTERHHLAPAAEIGLFRIFQEALTNVAKHARARTVQVSLERVEDQYRLVIADDGVGFEPAWPGGLPPPGPPRLGLLTMQERAEAVGGHLRIESQPGRGTRVIAEVPSQ